MLKLMTFRFLTIFLLQIVPFILISQKVVVWDFTDRERKENEITRSLTHEFEEALNEYSPFRAIDERDKDRFLASLKETTGHPIESSELKEFVNNNQIEMYVYGEFYDDINGGQANIKVTFESLKREKVIIKSVLIRRGLLQDPQSRMAKMIELVALINNTDEVSKKIESKYVEVAKSVSNEKVDTSYIRKLLQEEADVIVSFPYIGAAPTISVNEPSELFNKFKTYYSLDGTNYSLLENQGEIQLENKIYDNLYVKYITNDSLVSVGPILKDNIFLKVMKETVKKETQRNHRIVECNTGGCEVDTKFLLNCNAKYLKIVNMRSKKQTTIDIKKIKIKENKYVDICLTPIKDICVLEPDDELTCTLIYEDKSEITFKINTTKGYAPIDGFGRKNGWIRPERYNSKDTTEYPYFLIALRGLSHPMEFFIGINECSTSKAHSEPISILYDLDGKGMIELKNASYSPFQVEGMPLSDKIGIAIDLVSGKRLGPFYYKFNSEDVLQAATELCDEPRLKVTYDSDLNKKVATFDERLICLRNIMGVMYGTTPENLNEFYSVKIDDQQIFTLWFQSHYRDHHAVPRPTINPPEQISDLYYKLIFKDNKESKVIRLKMN